jgi:hypothetical protein
LQIHDEAEERMKYVITAGIVLALALINNSMAERDEQMVKEELIRLEAEKRAAESKAALYASLIAACFNGKNLESKDREIDCRIVRKP